MDGWIDAGFSDIALPLACGSLLALFVPLFLFCFSIHVIVVVVLFLVCMCTSPQHGQRYIACMSFEKARTIQRKDVRIIKRERWEGGPGKEKGREGRADGKGRGSGGVELLGRKSRFKTRDWVKRGMYV